MKGGAAVIGGSGMTSATCCVTCVNILEKQTGSFLIAHPDPTKTYTHTLSHTFVESPTAGDNIYRYKVTTKDGKATLQLPSYFKWLNTDVQMKISPTNHFGVAYGVYDESNNLVTFTSNIDGEFNVLIIGTRKDEMAICNWRGAERLKSASTNFFTGCAI